MTSWIHDHDVKPLDGKLEVAARVALLAMRRYQTKRQDFNTFSEAVALLEEALGDDL